MSATVTRALLGSRSSLRRVGLGALAVGLASAGLMAPAAFAANEEVRFTFNQPIGSMVAPANYGSAATRQTIVESGGGDLKVAASYRGQGGAAQYPGNNVARDGQRAVLRVSSAGAVDGLNPGGRPFVIGADIRLGLIRSSSVWDDGNNILQRGLTQGGSQYKIEIERGRASCRVAGAAGAVRVVNSLPVRQGSWYSLACGKISTTTGARVSLSVAPIRADGTRGPATVARVVGRPIGVLAFDRTLALSVGGKLRENGTIDPRSDQFNGVIDNPVLRVF